MSGRARGALGLAAIVAALHGCQRQPPSPSMAETVQATAERGPIRAMLAAQPARVKMGDTVTLTVTAEAPADYVFTLPIETDFSTAADAVIRVADSPDPRPGPRGLLWRRTFSIEPQAAAKLEIPAVAVQYSRAPAPVPPGAASEPQAGAPAAGALPSASQPVADLLVGPLTIEVTSALKPEDRPDRPRDITGTVLPPKPPWPRWVYPVVAGGLLAAAAGGYAAYRALRRWALRPAPPVLPEIWALRELERLAAEDWLARGRAREYYYRLTEVVRSYIERKFALAAPEMTTEEFLATLACGPRTLPYDAGRLRGFLEACDIVKYAAVQPRREEAEDALRTARAFVHSTAASAAQAHHEVTSTR